jgi:S1-C subfamily serine protease
MDMNDGQNDGRHSRPSAMGAIFPWLLVVVALYFVYTTWSKRRDVNPQLEAARSFRVQPDSHVPARRVPVRRAQRGTSTRLPNSEVPEIASGAVAEPRDISPRGGLDGDEVQTIDLFEKCSNSVVFIKSSLLGYNRFTMNMSDIPRGTGTGFMWDNEGHIVTNNHVLDNANKAQIILADQSSYSAKLIGREPDKDLAVLKIDAPPQSLDPLLIGTSRDLLVGQNVYAIGNPFGLDQTLTTGVISGLDRQIRAQNRRQIRGVIQTDAAINPGNSGGPLLDSAGRLIGVNTAIFSPSGAYAGIGFAIPVDTVNRIVPQLIKFGRVVDKPSLCISPAPAAPLRRVRMKGVLVLEVDEGGTAETMGIRPTIVNDNVISLGDIIVSLNGEPVDSNETLLDLLQTHEVGDETTVRVIRGAGTKRAKEIELHGKLQRATENR